MVSHLRSRGPSRARGFSHMGRKGKSEHGDTSAKSARTTVPQKSSASVKRTANKAAAAALQERSGSVAVENKKSISHGRMAGRGRGLGRGAGHCDLLFSGVSNFGNLAVSRTSE